MTSSDVSIMRLVSEDLSEGPANPAAVGGLAMVVSGTDLIWETALALSALVVDVSATPLFT